MMPRDRVVRADQYDRTKAQQRVRWTEVIVGFWHQVPTHAGEVRTLKNFGVSSDALEPVDGASGVGDLLLLVASAWAGLFT